MQLIYSSHSYRKPDASVVKFFGVLMRSEGLVPSLDPPSNRLNSASRAFLTPSILLTIDPGYPFNPPHEETATGSLLAAGKAFQGVAPPVVTAVGRLAKFVAGV